MALDLRVKQSEPRQVPALVHPVRQFFWVSFALRRLLRLTVILLGVAIIAFALAKTSPVDPVDAYLGPNVVNVSPEQREVIAQRWGFHEPASEQFTKWLANFVHGDLGVSSIFNEPVAQVLADRFEASLALTGTAWVLSGLLGFVLGTLAGAFEGSLADRVIRIYAYVLASTPTFWIAILLLIVFSVGLGVTPYCCAAPPGLLPEEVSSRRPAASSGLAAYGSVALWRGPDHDAHAGQDDRHHAIGLCDLRICARRFASRRRIPTWHS